jgi:hypothetical protein
VGNARTNSAPERFNCGDLMALEIWMQTMPDGTKAEYTYYQSDNHVWASRRMGLFLDFLQQVRAGLTREQIEDLFLKQG